MRRYTSYIWYILKHKYFVLLEGLQLGVPLWILVLHDWDKLLPDELIPYARATRDKNGKDMYVNRASNSFALAWRKHQQRNKHHWQYWLILNVPEWLAQSPRPLRKTSFMVWDNGDIEYVRRFAGVPGIDRESEWVYQYTDMKLVPIPSPWREEMLADWRGAGRAMGKSDTLSWYTKNRKTLTKFIHFETIKWLDGELGYE